MNIFSGLLFLHGHVASVELARQLASPSPTPPPSTAPGSAGRWPATSPTGKPAAASQRPAHP
ncbi:MULTISPECIES: hypothetical protein [Stenotrophomonas]|jgi:hypothetical protein|uniref:hypothetical protein n=1 Tax=Stenotrophomonas TaxID=40323 RepID=UPI00066B5FEB|nr:MULTISPECIES: hypothetical protein [Stenotrophomonas]MBH1696207.1 hypothetical protein [Stenotrophomonas maltophilia]MBH1819917.1 hypothetical protein [Stenotrophomonas maltophilia]MCU1031389.1 hypothetical protein [Stenotrophomonas maltophilia]MDH0552844.1 hypothetical protein [Stenotrophomonas sp. GD04006]PJL47122.1 hypothetical protein B9Y74_16035 [Stenotrophomonas maltophilia]